MASLPNIISHGLGILYPAIVYGLVLIVSRPLFAPNYDFYFFVGWSAFMLILLLYMAFDDKRETARIDALKAKPTPDYDFLIFVGSVLILSFIGFMI